MCGRFYVDDEMIREIRKIVKDVDVQMSISKGKDVYPSQISPIICARKQDLGIAPMVWGFPAWDKKGLLINARAETVTNRRMFKDSVKRRRCIIPARHFYEWDSEKQKVSFLKKDTSVIYMAGFYNYVDGADRFVIITTQANESVAPVHHRMPLVLEPDEIEKWVYNDATVDEILNQIPPLLNRRQEYEQQTLF